MGKKKKSRSELKEEVVRLRELCSYWEEGYVEKADLVWELRAKIREQPVGFLPRREPENTVGG